MVGLGQADIGEGVARIELNSTLVFSNGLQVVASWPNLIIAHKCAIT
jgi:hypothetical protein